VRFTRESERLVSASNRWARENKRLVSEFEGFAVEKAGFASVSNEYARECD
jgi:hypothetical protein